MKPQKPDIDWCLANRDLVMRWLEQRGGWQEGDWYWQPEAPDEVYLLQLPCLLDSKEDADLVWLVSSDDVLEMLGSQWRSIINVRIGPDGAAAWGHGAQGRGKTLLIALMELLKSVEGENENLSTKC